MKKFLVLLLCAHYSLLHPEEKSIHQLKAQILVSRCYKDKGLSPVDEAKVEKLIATIEALSPHEQAHVASLAQTDLQKEIRALKKKNKEKLPASEKKQIEYQIHLASIQEKHLGQFSVTLLKKETPPKKNDIWSKTSFTSTKERYTKAAQELVAYTKIERQKLLHDASTAVSFFHASNNATLPKIMRFWWFKPDQNHVIKLARKTSACITACAAAALEVEEGANITATVATAGKETIGVGEATAEQAAADVEKVAAAVKEAQQVTDPTTAVENISNEATTAATKMTDDVDPFEDLTLGDVGAGDAPKPTKSLNVLLPENQQATKALTEATNQLDQDAAQEVDNASTFLGRAKNIYSKIGLSRNAEHLIGNTAKEVQNGMEWLTKKYPSSTSLKLLTKGIGFVGKFGPMGIIKWLESSPTGSMLYGMLKLSIVMSGSSMFNSWINQQTFAAAQQLTQFQTNLANDMQNNVTRVQAAFAVKNAQVNTTFQTSFAQLNTAQASFQAQNAKNITYLNNALTESTMQQLYMSEPMYNDQLFLLSTMLTPLRPPQGTLAIIAPPQPSSNWQTATSLSFQQQARGSWTGPIVAEKKQLIAQITGTNTSAQIPSPTPVTLATIIKSIPEQQPAYPSWHNIFRRGNWEFEVNTINGTYEGSFVQEVVVPLTNPAPTDSSATPIFLQALYNSIFTQYIPPALYYGITETHVIQIACTLNKVSYPFFMGFDFNAGRWLSGVDQLRYQRRTLGILGSAEGQSAVWFGETFYMQPQQALQAQVNAVWPLWQFFGSATYAAVWAAANPNAVIATKPLYTDPASPGKPPLITPGTTIILSVATQPTQVTISAQIVGAEEPFIDNVVVPNLNPKTFVYHNIGLISAGCSASFTILHPQALRYPQTSLSAFLQGVQP